MSKSFQNVILDLSKYWADEGCVILQPYDIEVGAGTSHTATTLKTLEPGFWYAAFVQPSRRPKDGRYGENPNRTQMYYQFQTILKPAPSDCKELYIKSLQALGLEIDGHDIRFVEDDWENPSLGASGLGWEVWYDGMEITQFTYFQQMGGMECPTIPVEITYGLERITSFIQGVDNSFDINWNGAKGDKKITYGDVFRENEKQCSAYNFESANIEMLLRHFNDHEKECVALLEKDLVIPAYEQCLKANHIFNLLDARGVISTTERPNYMGKIRSLVKECCGIWYKKNLNCE